MRQKWYFILCSPAKKSVMTCVLSGCGSCKAQRGLPRSLNLLLRQRVNSCVLGSGACLLASQSMMLSAYYEYIRADAPLPIEDTLGGTTKYVHDGPRIAQASVLFDKPAQRCKVASEYYLSAITRSRRARSQLLNARSEITMVL